MIHISKDAYRCFII